LKRIRLIVSKDFRRRLRAPAGILILMVIPMLMTALFGFVFAPGSDSSTISIRILVVDQDRNFGARMLLQAFRQEKFADMFRTEVVNETDGRREIARGHASALLVIPEDFTTHLFTGKPSVIEVVKNPGENFLPQVAEEFTRTFALLASAAVAVFGDELAAIQPIWETRFEEIDSSRLLSLMEGIKPKITSLRGVISPPLIGLKTESDQNEKGDQSISVTPTTIFSVILPGMAILFMLFIVEIFMREILTEKEDGTLSRLLSSPIPPWEYVVAKIVSAWVMGMVVLLLLVTMGHLIFGIQWGAPIHVLLFGGATVAGLCGIFALLNAFFRNRNQAGSITAPVILLFSALGGSMIPLNQLPASIQGIGQFTPNYWFIHGTATIQSGVFPVVPALILLVVGIFLTTASLPLLVRRISP